MICEDLFATLTVLLTNLSEKLLVCFSKNALFLGIWLYVMTFILSLTLTRYTQLHAMLHYPVISNFFSEGHFYCEIFPSDKILKIQHADQNLGTI